MPKRKHMNRPDRAGNAAGAVTRGEVDAHVRSSVDAMARAFYSGVVDGDGRAYGGRGAEASFSTHDLLFSAMSLLMQDVAAIPRKLIKGKGAEAIDTDPVLDFVNDNPNPGRYPDGDYVVQLLCGYLLETGNAWIWTSSMLDSRTGLPIEMLVLGLQHVSPVIDYVTGSLKAWRITWGSQRKDFPPEYLTHVKLLPDLNDKYQILGCGPVRAAASKVDGNYARQLYDKAFFERGAEPSAVVRYGADGDTRIPQVVDKATLDAMVRGFKERHVGVENMRGVVGLNAGWHLEPFGGDLGDLQLVEMAVQGVKDVARIFKIPPPKLGDYSDVGLSREGIEATDIIYAVQAVVPLAKIVFSGLTHALVAHLNGRKFYLDRDEIDALRGRFEDKVKNYGTLVDKFVSPRVAAELVDLGANPDDLTDEVLVRGVVTTLEQATAEPEEQPAALAGAPPPLAIDEVDDLTDGAPEPVATDETARGCGCGHGRFARNFQPKRLREWRAFVAKWAPLETTTRNRLKRYFRGLRTETLANLERVVGRNVRSVDEDTKRILFDERAADRELRSFIAPYLEQAIGIGVDDVAEILGADPLAIESGAADALLRDKTIRVVRINDTLRESLRVTLREGLNKGEAINDLAARVRLTFQDRAENGASRTRTIARTEIGGAVNGSKRVEMKAQGVKKREWMTSGDEFVRDSHVAVDGEIRDMDEVFSNGLAIPGDPSGAAEEVINCRCTTTPVVA